MGDSPRLLIVSNRLPLTLTPTASGYSYAKSSGGLVSGLSGLARDTPFVWFGWPGLEICDSLQTQVADDLKSFSAIPIFLSEPVASAYYAGFSNGILWPLFHYHPNELDFNKNHWEQYKLANLRFAETLVKHIRKHDLVWIHDFHLMALPQLLRRLMAGEEWDGIRETVKIGFFLHTPFPSSEVYRILPVRKELLRGVLEADLIGFQTYDYARHFMSSCARILGNHCFPDGIQYEGRKVKVGTFPIGIDPPKFHKALESPSIQHHIAKLRARFQGTKIMLGVDRLDYIKALPQKIHAFSHLLHTHPELQDGKCVLIQIAVPSREDVAEYQNLDRVVNGLVGKVNGRFGTIESVPIHYVHKSVGFEELVALYAVADVCVVSSTRDGMNLVSYEYVAAQQGQHGVLVLSEFAGAAQSLNGAIIVNPWNTEELAQAMYDALTMPTKEQELNYAKLSRYVNKYTAERWGTMFVNELKGLPDSFDGTRLVKLTAESVVDKFLASRKKRIFIIDYDGTLKSNHTLPEFSSPPKSVKDLAKRLSNLPDTFVYIFSGRARYHLDAWFGDCGVGLSAEHGCFYRHPPGKFDDSLLDVLDPDPSSTSAAAIVPTSPPFSAASPTSIPISLSQTNLALLGESMISSPSRLYHKPSIHSQSHTNLPSFAAAEMGSIPRGVVVPLKSLSHIVPSPIPYSPLMRHISPFNKNGMAGSAGGGGVSPSQSYNSSLMKTPRRMQQSGWLALVDHIDNSTWCHEIRPLFQYYTERTPGSFVEEKEVNLTWHYRNADPEFGMWQAAELHVNLEQILNHLAVSVILGNKTVEVRPSMVDKATAARSVVRDLEGLFGQGSVDFVCCLGDGKTDEVVFSYLNEAFEGEAVTCTVGRKETEARFWVEGVKEVGVLLEEFCKVCEEMMGSGGDGGVEGVGLGVDVE
ncbi:Trehalose-6-P synthase/phosphatase complex synthase subunit [Podochytrium sp. JEL0797]|nr:Trehalose-6-P synthase/phosphatase complex synthase subunit [Podochytrium sp. JEL0797]